MGSHLNRMRYQREVLREPSIGFVPPIFVATITDQCNLRCPNCLFILNPDNKFFTSFISPQKFRDVLERHNAANAETLFLTGGEALLHPELDEIIAIGREYGLSVKMSTNGLLLAKKVKTVAKMDYVNVSMDSYDADTFEKYRGGTKKQFEAIMEGLEALKGLGINFSVSFVLSSENLHESEKMLDFARRTKARTVIFHNINPHGDPSFNSLNMRDAKTRQWVADMTGRTDYPFDVTLPAIFDPDSAAFSRTRCIQPWYYFSFNSIGDVSLCCHLEHDAKYGNAFEGKAFNAPNMVEFRRDVIKGDLSTPLMKRSCVSCQRRFMSEELGTFDSGARKWVMNVISEQP